MFWPKSFPSSFSVCEKTRQKSLSYGGSPHFSFDFSAFVDVSGESRMKKKAFYLGAILFSATLAVDAALIGSGVVVLGIFSLLGTILIFSSSIIWLIRQDDQNLHARN